MALDRSTTIFGVLYRRRLIVLLTVLGSVAGGYYYGAAFPQRYVAESSVIVPETMPGFSLNSEDQNIPNGPVLPVSKEEIRSGMMGIMSSGAIHERVAEHMPEISYSYLRKNVIGDIDRVSNFVILAIHENPGVAADIANEFTLAFEELIKEQAEHGPKMSLAALQVELPGAELAVEKNQADLILALAEMDLVDLDSEMQALLSERRRIDSMLHSLRLSRLVSEAQRPVLEELLSKRSEFRTTARQFQLNSSYTQLLSNLGSVATDMAVKRLTYKNDHPEMLALGARIKALEGQAQNSIERMVHSSTSESLDAETLEMLNQLVSMEIADASYQAQKIVLDEQLVYVKAQLQKMPGFQATLSGIQGELRHS
ncbi:MAG: hypothetical protein HN961_09200, partial [Planctomycetes bacterium]|nr:hypothetical protein [Planctomycetota bacterium]